MQSCSCNKSIDAGISDLLITFVDKVKIRFSRFLVSHVSRFVRHCSSNSNALKKWMIQSRDKIVIEETFFAYANALAYRETEAKADFLTTPLETAQHDGCGFLQNTKLYRAHKYL